MAAAPPAGRQGPPPLQPEPSLLSNHSSKIQEAISIYENAQTPAAKAAALQTIQFSSRKLSNLTTSVTQKFSELTTGCYITVANRIALEMGLYNALPPSGAPAPISELAKKTNAEEEFVLRIARSLAAFEVIEESDVAGQPAYSHTGLSHFLTAPLAMSYSRLQFDIMLPGHVKAIPGYYHKYGFANPATARNAPFTFAHGTEDKTFFDILETMPDLMAVFNKAMSAVSMLGLKETLLKYPFDILEPNFDGIVFVDVGGGRGHACTELKNAYPNLKGKVALEDMDLVLKGGTVVDEKEVVVQPYDFFKEVQPIKGSNYFFKAVFHDWDDTSCIKILQNLAPAMKGYPHSRLLICDLILPDRNPPPGKVLRDLNILLVAGKERSLAQWTSLLEKGGFKILNSFGLEDPMFGIIEATLSE